jgi:hypothetical protein
VTFGNLGQIRGQFGDAGQLPGGRADPGERRHRQAHASATPEATPGRSK